MVDSRVIIGGALSSMFLLIVGAILAYFFIYTPDGQAMIDPNYYNKKAEEERIQKEKEDKEKAESLKSLFPSAPTVTTQPAVTSPPPVETLVSPTISKTATITLATFNPKESQIKSRKRDNFCLDVPGVSQESGTQIEAWDCVNGKVNQMFSLDDKKRLVAKHSGKCLGVANSGTENGTKVIQWDCLDIDDQKWDYSPSGELRPMHAKDKCLDLFGGTDTNGTPLAIWDCHGGDNQKWYV